MMRRRYTMVLLTSILVLVLAACVGLAEQGPSQAELACAALTDIRNLTITSAELRKVDESRASRLGYDVVRYCYVKGVILPAIVYHVQLPLPENWNGRFLKWGDGGKDGDLDFADHRVAQGYAVANSNTGHDSGSEPRASFGFNNRQAEIDFGYRAVHLTINAAQTLIQAYYHEQPAYSYFEGCSTGGRQGLMEAQRYPYDFDGIVAGAPVHFYQELNTTHVWMLQKVFLNNFAGNLAYDTDGDGIFDSLTKVNMLKNAVLAKCDANDGIIDGVIDNPLSCDFDPEVDLAQMMCAGEVNADECYTKAQLQTIKDLYRGSYDSKGVSILKGKPLGSEFSWGYSVIPHAGNSMAPARMNTSGDHVNYLFYQTDPGVIPPDLSDPSHTPDKTRIFPEWAWWEFNIDDVTAGRGDFMKSITNATDPDLTRFLLKNDGKLILYHGWGDADSHPEPTLDYYKDVIETTFKGDLDAAKDHTRLFMAPGMAHCGGGPGPHDWDKLTALVDWVENGKAPDFVVATHSID
ncbi:tannase/feruloyl esterase family alpha/beta hydrolase, partial [Acidobacteria bacterium AH-259-D05]|nr:tannase/feruloyl esterase family alpha/beta hydrolase [Acidobacteria bacterium AH-259-D05]